MAILVAACGGSNRRKEAVRRVPSRAHACWHRSHSAFVETVGGAPARAWLGSGAQHRSHLAQPAERGCCEGAGGGVRQKPSRLDHRFRGPIGSAGEGGDRGVPHTRRVSSSRRSCAGGICAEPQAPRRQSDGSLRSPRSGGQATRALQGGCARSSSGARACRSARPFYGGALETEPGGRRKAASRSRRQEGCDA